MFKEICKHRKLFEQLVRRRWLFAQAFEIYGGSAGFWDLGPLGTTLKNNLQLLWKEHFLLEQDMLEIYTSCITPEIILQASGHVQRFTDFIVKDSVANLAYRADKLVSQILKQRLSKPKEFQQHQQRYTSIINNIQNYTSDQLQNVIQSEKILSPNGNSLSKPQPFNLMFKTMIGPSNNQTAYLRPETAQGIFVNFQKLVQYNCGKMPMAVCQLGSAFRNEISPRNGLLRVRQFPMAEIEHFLDPQDKSHPKIKNYMTTLLPLIPKMNQPACQIEWIEIGQALQKKLISNQTMAYYIVRIYLFLRECGLDKEGIRIRQHRENQLAHYSNDCWDAEVLTSHGWVECVGCADRSAYDLVHHRKFSGQKLFASRKLDKQKQLQYLQLKLNKKQIGQTFKQQSQAILKHLQNLQSEQVQELKQKFEDSEIVELEIDKTQCKIKKDWLEFQLITKNVIEEKYVPEVIQPSFGIGRILFAMLEHSFRVREQDSKRTFFVLKPKLAPFKCSLLPLLSNQKFEPLINQLSKMFLSELQFKKKSIMCKIDDSGQSIGKRYSRTDELGIPFAVTIDFQSFQDNTVTLRQLQSTSQVRVPISQLSKTVKSLCEQQISWSDIKSIYKEYISKTQ